MTGQNDTSTRNPHHLPENKGVWRELMLKNDNYSFSQEQVTLMLEMDPLAPAFSLSSCPHHCVAWLWRHTDLL